jgi:hypothetical protein
MPVQALADEHRFVGGNLWNTACMLTNNNMEKLSEIPPFCRQKTDNLSEKIKIIEKYLLARGLHYR